VLDTSFAQAAAAEPSVDYVVLSVAVQVRRAGGPSFRDLNVNSRGFLRRRCVPEYGYRQPECDLRPHRLLHRERRLALRLRPARVLFRTARRLTMFAGSILAIC
jgi:hypothetical protein